MGPKPDASKPLPLTWTNTMKARPLILTIFVLGSCREQPAPTPMGPGGVTAQRIPVATADTAAREQALIRALRSRYPANHQAALTSRLRQRNGVSQLVQLNDPDSQRLFDQIEDVRSARRSGVPAENGVRRVIVTFPLSGGSAVTARLVRRPPTVISGELVDAQYLLVVPPNAQNPDALAAILDAAPAYLKRMALRQSADTTMAIPWEDKPSKARHTSTVGELERAPVQDLAGIGASKTFPVHLSIAQP